SVERAAGSRRPEGEAATPWDTLSEYREELALRHARSPERRPSLARLRQAHGIKVLLAVNPALQAVDADLYPYVSVYAERDRFGILIPGDWGPGFELFDLAITCLGVKPSSASGKRRT